MKKIYTLLSILGLLLLGVAHVSAITDQYQGGTGVTSTTQGDLLVGNASTVSYCILHAGTNGQVPVASSTAPCGIAWGNVSGTTGGGGSSTLIFAGNGIAVNASGTNGYVIVNSGVTSTANIFPLFSAVAPIVYNSSTGQFSWINSNGYISTYSVTCASGCSVTTTTTSTAITVTGASSTNVFGISPIVVSQTGSNATASCPTCIATNTGNWAGTWINATSGTYYPYANPLGFVTSTTSGVTSFNTQTGTTTYSVTCVSGCSVTTSTTSSALTITGGGSGGNGNLFVTATSSVIAGDFHYYTTNGSSTVSATSTLQASGTDVSLNGNTTWLSSFNTSGTVENEYNDWANTTNTATFFVGSTTLQIATTTGLAPQGYVYINTTEIAGYQSITNAGTSSTLNNVTRGMFGTSATQGSGITFYAVPYVRAESSSSKAIEFSYCTASSTCNVDFPQITPFLLGGEVKTNVSCAGGILNNGASQVFGCNTGSIGYSVNGNWSPYGDNVSNLGYIQTPYRWVNEYLDGQIAWSPVTGTTSSTDVGIYRSSTSTLSIDNGTSTGSNASGSLQLMGITTNGIVTVQGSSSVSVVVPTGILSAGSCDSATTTIDTSYGTSTTKFAIGPQVDAGDQYYYKAFIGTLGVLTAKVCATTAGTPATTTLNIGLFK